MRQPQDERGLWIATDELTNGSAGVLLLTALGRRPAMPTKKYLVTLKVRERDWLSGLISARERCTG